MIKIAFRLETKAVGYEDSIIQTVCRILIPFIQIFTLYVVGHGHHIQGGGFQGGVLLGATYILLAISFNLKMVLGRISEKKILCWLIPGLLSTLVSEPY